MAGDALSLRVYFDAAEGLLDHLLDSREVDARVAVVRMLLHDRVVLPNSTLHPRVLVNEVVDVIAEPGVNLVVGLTPVAVLRLVLAVRYCDDGELIVGIHPRVLNFDLIAIAKAQRLVVPVKGVIEQKSLFVLLIADLKVVFVVEYSAAGALLGYKLNIRVVENIDIASGYVSASQTEDEVQTVVVFGKRYIELIHLLIRVENFS